MQVLMPAVLGGLVTGLFTLLGIWLTTRVTLRSVDLTTATTRDVNRENLQNSRLSTDKTIQTSKDDTEQRELSARREEWWRRFAWAAELSMDDDEKKKETGLELLIALRQSSLAGSDEERLILAFAIAYTGNLLNRVRRGESER